MWDKGIQAKGKVRQSSQKYQSQRQEFLSTYNKMWGPTIFGPAPFIRWGPKAQAEEGYGQGTVMQVQNSIGI